MKVELDDLDKSILNLLQNNARLTYTEISERLKTAEATIRFRFKRLVEKRVITKFVALLNPASIGFSVGGAILLKTLPIELEDITLKLSAIHEIPYIYRTTGEYDLVVAVFAQDMDHFNDLVKEIKTYPGVKDIRVSIITEFIKSDPTFKL